MSWISIWWNSVPMILKRLMDSSWCWHAIVIRPISLPLCLIVNLYSEIDCIHLMALWAISVFVFFLLSSCFFSLLCVYVLHTSSYCGHFISIPKDIIRCHFLMNNLRLFVYFAMLCLYFYCVYIFSNKCSKTVFIMLSFVRILRVRYVSKQLFLYQPSSNKDVPGKWPHGQFPERRL